MVSHLLEEYRDILAIRSLAGATNRVLAALRMVSRKTGVAGKGAIILASV